MSKRIDAPPSSPPAPRSGAGIENLLKDGLTEGSIREYLEAHPDAHAEAADYLMKNGKQEFVARHFGAFRVGERFRRVAELAQGDLRVLEAVTKNLPKYFEGWKEQKRAYSAQQARKLGNFLIAVLNARTGELVAADVADFEDNDDIDVLGDEDEHADQPGRPTMLRAQVFGALRDAYPRVLLNPYAKLEDFQEADTK